MDEYGLAGVERDASVGIGAGSPIFQIPFYAAPHVGELAPYLVMPSGKQLYLQKKKSVGTFY